MLAKTGFSQRNITIAALSLSVGIGFPASSEEVKPRPIKNRADNIRPYSKSVNIRIDFSFRKTGRAADAK